MQALSERRFFSFNLDANNLAEDFDKLRLQTRSFSSFLEKGCGASSLRTTSSSSSSSGNTEGIFITDVRKFSKDRYGNFITVSYRTMCWFKIRILEAASVLSVDPGHINSTEVAVSDMVCWLPPNHVNSKLQTTLLAFGPLMQRLSAWLAYHVWCPSFILVTKFNTKIRMVRHALWNLWLDSC